MTKILLVDDSDIHLLIQHSYLAKEGFSVFLSKSVQQALSLIAINDFDLLCVDIMMQGFSGYDLMHTLRSSGNPVKAIAVTALDAPNCDNVKELFVDWLIKPVKKEEYINTVKKYLDIQPLSRDFLLSRGHCCNSNCKNCPYK